MTYKQLINKQQEEWNKTSKIFFAFDDKQFKEQYEKYLEKYPEAKGQKLCQTHGGGLGIKKHMDELVELTAKHRKEMAEFMENPKNLKSGFITEMWNIEYGFMEEDDRICQTILNKDFNDLTEKELEIFNEARKEYLNKFYEMF